MDPVRNPFAPGAGTPPPELAGRQVMLDQAETTLLRVQQGRPSKSFLLVGLRGVGKTVLLVRMQQIADKAGYRTLMVEAREDKSLPELLLPPLRQVLLGLDQLGSLNEKVKRGLRVLRSFASAVKLKYGEVEIGLDIEPERGVGDSGDIESDLPDLLVAIAEAAAARRTAVALLMDELQYIGEIELSALIMGIHRIAQRELPLVLIGAGLPQLVGNTGRSKSYAERLFDFPEIGPLSPKDARIAIVEPITREDEKIAKRAVDLIVEATLGYPYFLQEWGYHCWNAADRSPISRRHVEKAPPIILANLDASFFRVRFDRLTPSEKRYLRAMAALGPGPHRSGDIAETLGAQVRSVAPLRSGLIRKGMIYSPAHGDTAFTVPLFDQFLKRQMPVLR
jgi:AAA ATPase-like protein